MRLLAVHPGPLMYTKIYLRLEPLGLELVVLDASGRGSRAIDDSTEDFVEATRMGVSV